MDHQSSVLDNQEIRKDHSIVGEMRLSSLQEQKGEEPQKTGQSGILLLFIYTYIILIYIYVSSTHFTLFLHCILRYNKNFKLKQKDKHTPAFPPLHLSLK